MDVQLRDSRIWGGSASKKYGMELPNGVRILILMCAETKNMVADVPDMGSRMACGS